ncbi:MAG: hypothetical protein QNK37_20275 [Acidobacteriota bacterium]|nr:hypothetical protein [Acidobacteriota bacterium]
MKTYLFCALLLLGTGILAAINANCIMLNLFGAPEIVRNAASENAQGKLVLLYGSDICSTCPSGRTLHLLQSNDMTFMVDPEFSDYEIQDFMETFQLSGDVVKADREVTIWLKRLAQCKQETRWRRNLRLTFNGGASPVKVETF